MKKVAYIFSMICILLLLAFGVQMSNNSLKNEIHLENKTALFIAGKPIQLVFTSKSVVDNPQLFIIHSYGKTLIKGEKKKGTIRFDIPEIYTQKSGVVSWFLIAQNANSIQGKFEIIPNNHTKTQIENYLGPRSILAGGSDFTMMVSVPTDGYDNPKPNGTIVTIKDQFLNQIHSENLETTDFISWKNIYSTQKSGQLLASTACGNTVSKEIETEVYPNIASDFSIGFSRNHDYADGNQITTFTTSVIKDQFGNIVSDGTSVLFYITNKNHLLLQTTGATINGIASGQILHPDHSDTYSVTAYITGIAKSNTIAVNYKPIMESFSYHFSNNNRKITVGPLKSFMGQLVPDGIKVNLKIFHKNQLVATLTEDSSRGLAIFKLPSAFYKEKEYAFEITTLGITQKTKTIQYDTSK